MSNYNLRDAEMTYDYPVSIGSGADNSYYPSIEFDVKMLPEISSWQVGQEYMLVLKVREKSHELQKSEEKGIKERACFEILEVGAFYDGTDAIRGEVKNKLK